MFSCRFLFLLYKINLRKPFCNVRSILRLKLLLLYLMKKEKRNLSSVKKIYYRESFQLFSSNCLFNPNEKLAMSEMLDEEESLLILIAGRQPSTLA